MVIKKSTAAKNDARNEVRNDAGSAADAKAMQAIAAENVSLRERLQSVEGQVAAVKKMLASRDAKLREVIDKVNAHSDALKAPKADGCCGGCATASKSGANPVAPTKAGDETVAVTDDGTQLRFVKTPYKAAGCMMCYLRHNGKECLEARMGNICDGGYLEPAVSDGMTAIDRRIVEDLLRIIG